MITTFKPLFTVEIAHTYYEGVCTDFDFTVPTDTARLLIGGRIVARVIDRHLTAAFEADAAGTGPRVSSSGKRLRFGLRLNNPYFDNFTALGTQPAGTTRLYRNSGAPGTLAAPEFVTFLPPLYSHVISGSTRPVTVNMTRDGQIVRSDAVSDSRTTATFDLRGLEPGRLQIDEVFPGGVTHTTQSYVDAESQRDGVFGLVEIQLAAAFYTTPPAFKIAFDAKEGLLKYYVVVSNYSNADVALLNVQDAGFVEESRPEIRFSKVAAPSFGVDDMQPASIALPGSSVVLFKSQAPVRRRAVGRRKLQLKKNGDPLIESLPQPGAANATADLVVHLSKPKRA
jgi:hypothetical protein